MKKTIEGFCQNSLLAMKLQCEHAVLLRWFVDYRNAGLLSKRIFSGEEFHHIDYQFVISSLPVLGITNREVIGRKFKSMVKADLLFCKADKRVGTYMYYRINPVQYAVLIDDATAVDKLLTGSEQLGETPPSADAIVERHSTGPSSASVITDGKIDPYDPTGASAHINTLLSYNKSVYYLIVEARRDERFQKEFRQFCIDTSSNCIRDTEYWICHNADKYKCSVEDIVYALTVCNRKKKSGNLPFATGILRKRAHSRQTLGSSVGVKNRFQQTKDYLSQRIECYRDIIRSYSYDEKRGSVSWTPVHHSILEDCDSASSLNDYFNKTISEDIRRETGERLYFEPALPGG
jgi:hypothetical protein